MIRAQLFRDRVRMCPVAELYPSAGHVEGDYPRWSEARTAHLNIGVNPDAEQVARRYSDVLDPLTRSLL